MYHIILVHRVQTMPRYSAYVNKEEDKILMEYGEALVKEGHIEAPVNRYKLIKFILNKLIKHFKDKVNQPNIPTNPIEEKKPVEQETKNNEKTEIHSAFKGLR